MFEVSTSILTVKKEDASKVFLELEVGKTDYFHIDVMDGIFVKNNTYERMLDFADTIKRTSNLPLDVHLMVKDVKKAINDFGATMPNIITVHYESFDDKKEIYEAFDLIKEYNCKVGISVKPDTNIEEIYEFLPFVHLVLVMTVEPGEGGQALLFKTLEKISKLRKYLDDNKFEIDIEVDGGVNLATMDKVKDARANILVSGSAILKANNYGEIIKELKKEIE